MQNLTILGATGSIGTSTLKIVELHQNLYSLFAISGSSNQDLLLELCFKWHPKYVVISGTDHDELASEQFKSKLAKKSQKLNIEQPHCIVLFGSAGLSYIATHDNVDMVMAAIIGAAGLIPTLDAVKAGKKILLANKESLVMSGQIFIDAAKRSGAQILPVDSEHNAIFQCLPAKLQTNLTTGNLASFGIDKIILTGSGGALRDLSLNLLSKVTPEQAISHPNWSMGKKISIDSATMMNKGLEYIEAKWLFNASAEQLQIIIHPQSIIHSMVQYVDGSVLAQLGAPDMATPIACAMSYPNRVAAGVRVLDFTSIAQLTFMAPDFERYPCLALAIDACVLGQHATTALNAANEIAVELFLQKKILFTQIAQLNELVLNQIHSTYNSAQLTNLESLLALDQQARRIAFNVVGQLKL